MTNEERNEVERMENEGAKSAWWNEPISNPCSRAEQTFHEQLESFAEIQRADRGRKISEARDNLRKVPECLVLESKFKPYIAWSYAGHGWVEVRSEAQGHPLRRLCAKGREEFLVADSMLQGEPPTGD
jgi:hypothetical protein